MLRKVSMSVLVVAVMSASLCGQAGAGDGRLTLYGGVTRFADPASDSLVLVEFPFSLNRHEFEFYQPLTDDSLFYARIFAQIDLFGTNGAAIDSASTYFSACVKDCREASVGGYRLFNKLSLYLAPGVYSARLTVIDAVSKRRAEVFHSSFEVIPPVKNRVTFSDIYTAYDVRFIGDTLAGVDLRMVKNGFKVVPNPISTFSTDDSAVHLYTEVYNLSYYEDRTARIAVSLVVLDTDSIEYRNFGRRLLESTGTSAVITESFTIDGWLPGVYYARLILLDQESSQADTAYAPFQIVSEESLAAEKDQRSDPYDTLSLQMKERLVTYLLTPPEKTTLSRLGDRAKLNYLDQYWAEHDEYPETPEIENRLDLIERFEEANRLYSTNAEKTNGWFSHLGRVLLRYGRPSEIEDKTAEWVSSLPMQIWYYWEWEEGKFFLFADYRHDFDFTLVHSNVEGEIYDKDWQKAMDAGWIDIGFTPFGED